MKRKEKREEKNEKMKDRTMPNVKGLGLFVRKR
jgi:hypothetical protein